MSAPFQTLVPTAASPVERLLRIINGLCAAIAARGAGGMLTAPLFFLLWSRLRRMAMRAAARIAAGAPQPVRPPPAAPRPFRPQPLRLPRGYAWLVRLVPGTAAYGTQLQALLADPLMAPLASAPSMRRLLAPLCQMLGTAKPPPPAAPRNAGVPSRPVTTDQDSGARPEGYHPPPSAPPLAA